MQQLRLIFWTCFFLMAGFPIAAQDCVVDTIPPDPIIRGPLFVDRVPGEPLVVQAEAFDAGSQDNCAASLDFKIQITEPGFETPLLDSVTVDPAMIGNSWVAIWVGDEAGNWSSVFSFLYPLPCAEGGSAHFNGDRAVDVVINSPSAIATLTAEDFNPQIPGPCTPLELLGTLTEGSLSHQEIIDTGPQLYTMTFEAADIGTHHLTLSNFSGNIGNLVFNAYVNVVDQNGVGEPCSADNTSPLIDKNFDFRYLVINPVTQSCGLRAEDAVSFAMDNCTAAENLEYRIVRLSESTGTVPVNDTLFFEAANFSAGSTVVDIEAWVGDQAGNWNQFETQVVVVNGEDSGLSLGGKAYFDEDSDCTLGGADGTIEGLPVQAYLYQNGQILGGGTPFTATTNSSGDYNFLLSYSNDTLAEVNGQPVMIADTAGLELFVDAAPTLNTGSCTGSYLVPLSTASAAGVGDLDFALSLTPGCPSLFADIGAPFLRRCIDSSNYVVQYANYGAEVAYVEVDFDSFLTVQSSSIPWSAVDGQRYTFPVGDLGPGEEGDFTVTVAVSCDAVLGQTHCTSAHIFPDTLCGVLPYSGPSIEVRGSCNPGAQLVEFQIENTGTQNMMMPRNYIVVEDVIMLEGNTFELEAGETLALSYPANGSTYRLEAEQAAGHPGLSMPSASVEGCGTDGSGGFSLGFVTQFSENDFDPFVAIDCQPNIGAYDPNDKLGYPTGIGSEHLIRKADQLDYRIRFQNTGTDTAFTVVILDTLSEHLDLSSVRPGASSHDYSFSILEGRVLEFRFDNILLPDSTTNLAASQGFVKFTVQQAPGNPVGTVIENRAGIYFDLNAPNITNTTVHRIGEIFVEVEEAATPGTGVKAFPNPAADWVRFELSQGGGGEVQVFDAAGRPVIQQAFRQPAFTLRTAGLQAGWYTFLIVDDEGRGHRGRLIIAR